jgi:hypothetical protein
MITKKEFDETLEKTLEEYRKNNRRPMWGMVTDFIPTKKKGLFFVEETETLFDLFAEEINERRQKDYARGYIEALKHYNIDPEADVFYIRSNDWSRCWSCKHMPHGGTWDSYCHFQCPICGCISTNGFY